MTAVYLAGPYAARLTLRDYGSELTRIGYKVTATWLEGKHEPTDKGPGTAEEQASWAAMDLADIRRSELLVAFTAAAAGTPNFGLSGGRHVETGYALARSIPVVLVGGPENIFHSLTQVTRVPDWHEAVIELAARLTHQPRAVESAS